MSTKLFTDSERAQLLALALDYVPAGERALLHVDGKWVVSRANVATALHQLYGELHRLRVLEEKAKTVVDFYPTVAGTAILIKNANRHVPRNPWDNVADAIYDLSRAVQS